MNSRLLSRRPRIIAVATSVLVFGALLVAVPQAVVAGPTAVTQTFSYTGSSAKFTVPAGISALTITVTGGQGGNGGSDATPAPPAGGYRGVVTGTIAVTPNQELTIGVGSGGATGASRVSASTPRALGGANPLTGQFAGGAGGQAGANGSSGAGGAGGAASAIQIDGAVVVAGGGGGNGGSGQFAPTQGRTATGTYLGRTDSTSTTGQAGINANDACVQSSCSNNDGGGSGGGGGGALGGAQGQIEFGAGASNEWYGFGGSVGQNATGSISGLTASYEYYSTNSAAGSVVITYKTGTAAAPTAVNGTAADGAVNLIWTAPLDSGQSVITNYLARYSSNNGADWSSPIDLGTAGTVGSVSGLTNGTALIFQVAAVTSVGAGVYSAASSPVTPIGPPTAPTINLVTPQDGALGLTLTAPTSGASVTGYDYRLDGGSWVAVSSPSTSIIIPGLINGTSYSVDVRAESSVGAGAISETAFGTPLAVPGAPTVSSLAAGNGTLSVEFTPGFSGGGAITAYEYKLNDGSWVEASSDSSPLEIAGLAAGTAYSVVLRAVNSVGAGSASDPASATTPALPDAPTIGSVSVGDGTVQASFTPGNTGGAPIDSYEYQITSGGSWVTVPAGSSPVFISGLTNGTTYALSIRSVNAVGPGTASSAVAVTPATAPGAPTIVGNTVTGSDATLSAAFTAPTNSGGSAITEYEYSTDAGATWRTRTDSGGTANPVVIVAESSDGVTPLTNGVTYYVELRAVNAMGAGAASAVATGIATKQPSEPKITAVTPSNGSLGVSFIAGSNGGAVITSYEYSIDGGSHWLSTGTLSTSFVVSALSNGTDYPVQIRATNSVGAGNSSAAVTGTPVGLPGQASISKVVRSNRTLTASVGLADNGGSPVTAWQYSTDAGESWSTASGTVSPLTLTFLSSDGATRLANGTGYALQVRAITAVGDGPASMTTIVAPASAPAAPSIAVTAGNTTASVAFTLSTDGGSPVTQLEYSLDGGSHWKSTGTLSSPFAIGGLDNGATYAIQLRANNAIGTGTPSVTTSTTPRTVPGVPESVVAASNSASADIRWTAPTIVGGAPITGYVASAFTSSTGTTPVSTCSTSGATTCSIASLANSTEYFVEVTAINAAGTGAASTPRTVVIPLARPAAPTLNSLSVGDSTISAAFSAGSTGDRAINAYQYSTDAGSTWTTASGTSSPILITDLDNGTTFTVVLRAVSTAGVGAISNAKQATPFTYPSAPDPATIVANGGDRKITVSWAAANLNGGALLNYTATAFSGLNSGSTSATCTTTSLSCVITGLQNGTTYYVSLQTQNTSAMYSVRSAPRVPATPSLQPGAATTVTATAGDATAAVSWNAPTSTGASAITAYAVWCSENGGAYSKCASSTTASAEITGLTNGSDYTFTVSTTNSDGTGPVSEASDSIRPLRAGTTPVFSPATSTATGFTATITNYDAMTSYSATATNGATVVVYGSSVTVTGLSDGATTHVTVTAEKGTATTKTASLDGAALLTGVAPLFSGNVATPTGFDFTITNFDSTATYALSAGSGATVSRDEAIVTVSGLTIGDSSAVNVVVTKSGSTTASSINSGAAMIAGTTPTFTGLVSTGTGYRVDIGNYKSALSYTLGVSGGATVIRIGSTITVTGLSDGASADVTVTVTDPGVSVATVSTTGSALFDGAAPTFSSATQAVDGFSFTITNPDSASIYTVTTSAGSVALNGSTVTVTGLGGGKSAEVTVTATKTGYLTTQAVVSNSALREGVAPLFGVSTPTNDGYSFTVSNFDADSSYLLSSTAGTVTFSGAKVTVAGLAPAETASVTVTVSQAGYTDAAASSYGIANKVGIAPTYSSPVATAGGFVFTIQNYSAIYSYESSTSAGIITRTGDRVTVAGLNAGATAVVNLVVTRAGFDTAAVRVTGRAAIAEPAPATSEGSSPDLAEENPSDGASSGSGSGVSSGSDAGSSSSSSSNSNSNSSSSSGSGSAPSVGSGSSGSSASGSGVSSGSGSGVGSSASGSSTSGSGASSGSGSSSSSNSSSGSNLSSGSSTLLAPLRESKAGTASVTSAGESVSSTIARSAGTLTVSASNGLILTVASKRDGTVLSLAEDGSVEIERSGELWFTMRGLAPDSVMTIWSLGSAAELAASHTDAFGATATDFVLPRTLAPGVHTLVVTGVDTEGNPVTMQVGIRVIDPQSASTTSPIGSTWWIWLAGALFLLLLLGGFLGARARLRHNEE